MKKIIVGLIIVLLTLESMAWLAPNIVGYYVYKPFSQRTDRIGYFYDGILHKIKYEFNEHGARGRLYEGEPIRIAILGQSNSVGLNIDQEDFWGKKLEDKFCYPVHVESYGVGNIGDHNYLDLLNQFESKSRYYDLIILMHSFGGPNRKQNIFRYTAQYQSDWGIFRWVDLLNKYIQRNQSQFKSLYFIRLIKNLISKTLGTEKAYALPAGKPEIKTTIFDRELRQSGQYSFRYTPITLSRERREMGRDSFNRFLSIAKTVSSEQMIVPAMVAYAEPMNEEIEKSYMVMHPIGDGTFYDPKAFAEKIFKRADFTIKLAKEFGLLYLDSRTLFSPLLKTRKDLFLDELHLSDRGSKVFSENVYLAIKPLLDSVLKLKIDKGLDSAVAQKCRERK